MQQLVWQIVSEQSRQLSRTAEVQVQLSRMADGSMCNHPSDQSLFLIFLVFITLQQALTAIEFDLEHAQKRMRHIAHSSPHAVAPATGSRHFEP